MSEADEILWSLPSQFHKHLRSQPATWAIKQPVCHFTCTKNYPNIQLRTFELVPNFVLSAPVLIYHLFPCWSLPVLFPVHWCQPGWESTQCRIVKWISSHYKHPISASETRISCYPGCHRNPNMPTGILGNFSLLPADNTEKPNPAERGKRLHRRPGSWK